MNTPKNAPKFWIFFTLIIFYIFPPDVVNKFR